jgi:ubiquinol-cytochrome c reductase iron-sulfur subunit
MSDIAAPGATGETRRDFLHLATGAVAGVGAIAACWPLIDQMNPARNVLALATTEVDLSPIVEGQTVKVVWRGSPVYISHRTPEKIAAARSVDLAELKDPEADEERVQKPEWLVMSAVCPHLGCVAIADAGDYGGWFCPCHGSHFDTSGRIREGPSPTNLKIPQYAFLDDTTVRIG